MAKKKTADPSEVMVVNDLPGDECRIAILEDNHLEELYTERAATATNVSNIYKGRVVNVEPAIQAAFVDYGQGANGFLHISDLHPRYFPGDEQVERVGKKIPRRDRPAMQDALKRGDEIIVQVLKEGIGSKGPTLTSYLSIPGRFVVLMPWMDRVGVSRKVEDDESRRAMRKVLDAVDLPDGFGFILRTAGLEQTKTEIKRDIAYLMRVWKQMEKRIEKVGAPCPLYAESDLLLRTIRDLMRPSIKAIVVDSDSAFERASAFLQVITPRSAPKVVRYRRTTPIFHAFDIERQIELIHSREVPLPSGGALVIDQTEALVAIDVNSGRSRSARDSETNAYRTNCEAVDEICRQLRLRDLGGLIVNDLIDMRQPKHRKSIEDRMRNNLKRDRARTTIARISEFGIMEMTRQRMRPSILKSAYVECHTCSGRGAVKAPDTVAAEVVRQVAFFMDQPRVSRIEIVCSPRVASVLLSRKRRQFVELEDESGCTVDVRVSDDIPVGRVDYYAYDDRSSDIAIGQIGKPKIPTLAQLEKEAESWEPSPEADSDTEEAGEGGRRRRRRRRRKPGVADASAVALAGDFVFDVDEEEGDDEPILSASDDAEDAPPKKKRRRRGRRGRGKGAAAAEAAAAEAEPEVPVDTGPIRIHVLAKEIGVPSKDIVAWCGENDVEVKSHMSSVEAETATALRKHFAPPAPEPEATDEETSEEAEGAEPKRRRRRRGGRRRRRKSSGEDAAAESDAGAEADAPATDDAEPSSGDDEDAPPKKKRRRRGGRKKKGATEAEAEESREPEIEVDVEEAAKPKTRRKTTKKTKKKVAATAAADSDAAASNGEPKPKPRKRGLYGSSRRTVSTAAARDAANEPG